VVLDMPSEDVADGDVDKVEVGRQALGLRPLATPLDAHDHVLAHPVSLSDPSRLPVTGADMAVTLVNIRSVIMLTNQRAEGIMTTCVMCRCTLT
jgi:hypothetical protein